MLVTIATKAADSMGHPQDRHIGRCRPKTFPIFYTRRKNKFKTSPNVQSCWNVCLDWTSCYSEFSRRGNGHCGKDTRSP